MKSTPVRSKNAAMRTVGQVSIPTIKPISKPVGRPRSVPKTPPNFNILKLMNGFVSFRSTVQELNQSLQQLVTIMDGASKMFFGRDLLSTGRRPFSPQLPSPPASKQEFEGEEIPVIELPKTPAFNSPLLSMLGNIDMSKVTKMFQSPIFQNILTRMFPQKQAATKARTTIPRKRNVRKRVKAY